MGELVDLAAERRKRRSKIVVGGIPILVSPLVPAGQVQVYLNGKLFDQMKLDLDEPQGKR